jgi:acetylornithine/succinyldiaminopimelate/putrescine aminotransferase
MRQRHPFTDTYEQILREQLPNLLRLYLNPHVTAACFCLGRYVASTWQGKSDDRGYQTFIANGFDEALSGAIKLARYCTSVAGQPRAGLVLDAAGRLGPFADAAFAGGRIDFVPGLTVVNGRAVLLNGYPSGGPFGFVVLIPAANGHLHGHAAVLRQLAAADRPLVIICVGRDSLASLRSSALELRTLAPDIVVFDESFVNHDVPFGAFTARRIHYDHWNRPGTSTFHSTTYQPNTIASLHFLRCLEQADPGFHASLAPDLAKIHSDLAHRGELFRRLYSPSLYQATCATGFASADVRAAGDFVFVDGRPIFDAISGVACSVRGHNPPSYAGDLAAQDDAATCRAEVAARLRELTGLECLVPAVSGATAVENALKLALVAQFPRRHVVALKAGFGGKTLLALTGTANPSYKQHIEPLYADVHYVDPFAANPTARLEELLTAHPVAVVQVELIQAVGGVRRVPEAVLRFLAAGRQRHGYLLLVDEVQTGMHRTGPFALSIAMGLAPDLLILGKGTSDMMFPFALVLYRSTIGTKLDQARSDLPEIFEKKYGYEFGYRTVLNVLRQAVDLRLPERVAASGSLFERLLTDGLKGARAVREVRVYGLLIGIELDATRRPGRWFRKRLYWFYFFSMLRHGRYPVLVGFCQYEPNVLKITPALTVASEEIRAVCATLVDVLTRPFYRLVGPVLRAMIRSLRAGRQSPRLPKVRPIGAYPENGDATPKTRVASPFSG